MTRSFPHALAALVCAIALAGCDSPSDARVPVPSRIDAVSGDAQEAIVGTTLRDTLVVRVTDDRGKPVSGRVVDFRVISGGGSVSAAATETDSRGEARARWTLGTSIAPADSQRVQALVVNGAEGTASLHATFRAVAKPDAPAAVAVLSGVPADATVGTTLSNPLAVRVADRYGNPVAGQQVQWGVVRGGGSVSGTASSTDSSGVARTSWTLGTSTAGGVQEVEATVPGLPAVPFVVNSRPGPAASAAASGAPIEGTVGTALGDPLAVRVSDRYGNPLAGVQVLWIVARGGGFVSPAASLTDSSGVARTSWTLGTSTRGGAQVAEANA
jgi:hypothetical protein